MWEDIKTNWKKIKRGQLRHVASGAGYILIGLEIADADDVNVVLTGLGIMLSIYGHGGSVNDKLK